MKTKFTLFFLLIYALTLAQAPPMLWNSFFNGSLTGQDEARSVITDSVGNVYVTGTCYQNFSGGNFTTIKYNPSGIQQWADHYAQTLSGFTNDGLKLVKDRWNNIYAVGTMAINLSDLGIIKYNSSGRLWAHNYEPYWFGSDIDYGKDIAVDTFGNLYAIAQMTSLNGQLWDVMVLKTDSAGTEISKDTYSSASGDDWPTSIAVTPGGNTFALSSSFNFWGSGNYDITTLNYVGSTQNWVAFYNGPGNDFDYGTFIKADVSGNQYVCGSSNSGTNDDMVVLKRNLSDSLQWSFTYNGIGNGNDTAISTALLPNGFVVVTGRCKEMYNSIVTDAIVTILLDSGTVVWTRKFYGSSNTGAVPLNIITDAAGNIFICGYEVVSSGTLNGCIIRYDSNGNLQWNISYDGGLSHDDKFNSITLDNNQNILVTGQSFTTIVEAMYVTVKYGSTITTVNENNSSGTDLLIYPNPAEAGETIKIKSKNLFSGIPFSVYDLAGRIIDNGIIIQNELKIKSRLQAGTYIIELYASGKKIHQKIFICE